MSTQLEDLPPGTIVRRVIRGKERFYHQWRENGKTLSRYLKADEILPLREKIEKRKALSAERKRGVACIPRMPPGDGEVADLSRVRFACGVLSGERLSELAASVRQLKPRAALEPIVRFIKGSPSGRLLAVLGLPQSGKTTLLRQAILTLDTEATKTCAYLSLPNDIPGSDLFADLHRLANRGISRVLIDGIDRSGAYRSLCQVLEDTFAASGMRIVLTASRLNGNAFPAKTEIVSTTFSAYRDFLRENSNSTLDDYLRSGGPNESQIGSCELLTLDAFNRRVLLRVLNDAAHRRTAWSSRLGSDIHKLIRRLGERLGEAPLSGDLARLRELDIVATAEDETFCILPGLRHSLSERLVHELLADDTAVHLGAAERKIVEDTILNLVADRTLADLVLYQLMRTRNNETTDVFRVRFPTGGFDAVIADREELTCELYEVRNARERNDQQLLNLTDPNMLDTIEHRYGTIVSRTLVYNGRNAWHTSGIAYRKAADFL